MATIKESEIPLTGVDSEHCANIVDTTLAKIPGVKEHSVELNNKIARVGFDPAKTNVSELVDSVRDIGYGVATVKKSFPVKGMTCSSCASSVESMLKSTDGVVSASVNFAASNVTVEYFPSQTNSEKLNSALKEVGYELVIDETGEVSEQDIREEIYQDLKKRTIGAAALSLPVVVIAMFFMHMPYGNWIMLALSLPVILWFGRSFYVNAWKQAKHRRANMDTLVALSTGVAFIFSLFNTVYPDFFMQRGIHPDVYYEGATVIIAFILLGKTLEEKAKSGTSQAISKLMGLQPKTVTVIRNGVDTEIPIDQVQIDDTIKVRPGEKVAVDGIVISGNSYVDESMISGEPVPVLKEAGQKVLAGTVNQKGSFTFSAQKIGSDTMLAQIIEMVRHAQGSKAPVQALVDKISGIFVPVVIVIAILSFITWMVLGETDAFAHALLAFVTVLVIACPCALGLATPTAIMVGIGKGAENGILIKDAEGLEKGHKVNAIILDKTGTITEGRPSVTNQKWLNPEDEKNLSNILLAMEEQSEHPLAEAIKLNLLEKGFKAAEYLDFESLTARGVKARFNDEWYFAGNRQLMEEQSIRISTELANQASKWQEEAKTVIWFASSKETLAVFAISDQIKPGSKEAIASLEEMGIEVYMLTGDNKQTAAAVAKTVGVKHFMAEMLPSGKAEFAEKLQSQGKVVAMVGDGINDSHALAQADVSIAMGRGSDIAMDVAKMVIMSSDLKQIPKAFRLSKYTVRTVRQNLFWAFIYNLIGIPIAAGLLYPFTGFLLNPMIAGAAMAFSSVSVVTNSLRLKTKKIN